MRKVNFKLFFTVLLMCCTTLIMANDACGDAIPLDCNATVSGSTAGATVDGVAFCGTSNTAPGVWYSFTGTGGDATLSTCNQAAYDTKISVFSGSCAALTCVGGNDDGTGCSGFTSELTFGTSAGTTYYVLVHGFGSASGSFNLTLTCTETSENDDCAGAIAISCDETVSGSTADASADGADFCGTSNTAPGVWYLFTPTENQLATISTCSDNTDYDTKVSVFSGSCGALACEEGDDDDFSCASSSLQSRVDLTVTSGTTYYILVHGFGNATGAFDLSVACSPLPAHDDPCEAVALTLGTAAGLSNAAATADAGEVSPGAGTDTGDGTCNAQDGWCSFETDVQNSLWYTFTVPASGAVSVSASGFDTQIAIWSADDCGDYATYSEVGANDDGGPGLEAAMDLYCLTPGDLLYLQVDGFGGATGEGEVLVTEIAVSALSCDAGGCQTKFVGYEPAEGLNHLIVTASGGVGPYTYEWSGDGIVTNSTWNHISVDPAVSTVYTVSVTDAVGCVTTCSVAVYVQDVVCYGGGGGPKKGGGNGNPKVSMCHTPPGNPNNAQQLCLSPNAVADHLENHPGDILGECGNTCLATNPPPPACVNLSVDILTDNFGSETSWELADANGGVIASGDGLSSGTAYTVFDECVVPGCYSVTLYDSFGDGICCSFGQGNWSVTYDGVTTASPTGGAFGSSESISVGCEDVRVTATVATPHESKVVHATDVSVYPNPFTTNSVIRVVPEQDGVVQIEVIDLNGQVISTLYSGLAKRGTVIEETIIGDQLISNGIYLYRIQLADETIVGKIVYAH